jgi:hypothetical protein
VLDGERKGDRGAASFASGKGLEQKGIGRRTKSNPIGPIYNKDLSQSRHSPDREAIGKGATSDVGYVEAAVFRAFNVSRCDHWDGGQSASLRPFELRYGGSIL